MPRAWCVMDLVTGQDGKLVMTKVQACTFHALMAFTVGFITVVKGEFLEGMWTLYAAVAVGHAVIDKTTAQVADIQRRKLDAKSAPAEHSAT